MRVTRLSQVLAVEQGAKAAADHSRELAAHQLAQANYPQMTGLSKTYEPLADNPTEADKLPAEGTKVQISVESVLAELARVWAGMLDTTMKVEDGNSRARGTIRVDGRVLLDDVPVTWLLGLEKRLAELGKLLDRLPVLDPANDWEPSEPGIHKTDVIRTMRGTKVPRVQELSPATKEHPAQVQMWMEDKPHGHWNTVKYSGMLPASRIRELKDRCAALAQAVKFARHEANSQDITERDDKPGDIITGYLLGSARAQAQGHGQA